MQPTQQKQLLPKTAVPDPIAGGSYTRDPKTGQLTQVKPDTGADTKAAPSDHTTTQQE